MNIQELTLIVIVFLALHLIILPYLCSDLAYSVYFKKTIQVEDVEYDTFETPEHRHGNTDMAIIVQTSMRDISYRNKTLLSVYKELVGNKAGHQVIVCSADARESDLKLPEIFNFKPLQPCVTQTEACLAATKEENKEKKIVKDFVLCHDAIENEVEDGVRYLLWLEDDVVLMEDFFSTLASIMIFRKSILQFQNWLDIKLYLNPRLRGNSIKILK